MPSANTVSEARKLLSRVPDVKGTLLALLMGLILALIAQLILRPLEVREYYGNVTLVYGGSYRTIITISLSVYVGILVVAFCLAMAIYWSLQMRFSGLSGKTLDVRTHGLQNSDDIKRFVDELTDRVQKTARRIGWRVRPVYHGENKFSRILESAASSSEITLTIDEEHVKLQSQKGSLSLEIAGEILKEIDELLTLLSSGAVTEGRPNGARTQRGIITGREPL